MIRNGRLLRLAACWTVLTLAMGLPGRADDGVAEKPAVEAQAKPVKALGAELSALRELVRRTLAVHRKQTCNTQENFPAEIMSCALAFGCAAEVQLDGADGKHINAITCLCWNYPCAGYEMLGFDREHISPRIGYGYQQHPGEFLAMLAFSRVPADYPVRVGKITRTIADVIEAERLGCRSGADLSLKLIGLSYYVEEPEWKNDLGETWSIERMIQEELAKPIASAPEGGLNRLMGLSYAVARRAKRNKPIDGQYRRARKFAADYQDYALKIQNSDGSWGPYFLAARSSSDDAAAQLRASGRILEWLAFSLPDAKLEDLRIVRAAQYGANLLGGRRYQWSTPSLSTREIASVGHALHALMLYDERVLRPADAPIKAAAK